MNGTLSSGTSPASKKSVYRRIAQAAAREHTIRLDRWNQFHRSNETTVRPEIVSPIAIQFEKQNREKLHEFAATHAIVEVTDRPQPRTKPMIDLLNPDRRQARRRGKLYAQLHALAALADNHGLQTCLFVTLTLNSPWHWNADTYNHATPKQAAARLDQSARRVRERLNRRGIKTTCIKGREPHSDGTPHDHMLIRCQDEDAKIVACEFRRAFTTSGKAHQLHGVKIEKVKCQKAAESYIGKYITKNTTGGEYPGHLQHETHRKLWQYKGWHTWVTGPAEFRRQKPHSTMYHMARSLRSTRNDQPQQLKPIIDAACRNDMLSATLMAKQIGLKAAYQTKHTDWGTTYRVPRWIIHTDTGEKTDTKPTVWEIQTIKKEEMQARTEEQHIQSQMNDEQKALRHDYGWKSPDKDLGDFVLFESGNSVQLLSISSLSISSQAAAAAAGRRQPAADGHARRRQSATPQPPDNQKLQPQPHPVTLPTPPS